MLTGLFVLSQHTHVCVSWKSRHFYNRVGTGKKGNPTILKGFNE